MPTIGFGSADAYRVAAEFEAMGSRAPVVAFGVTQRYTLLMATRVKGNASGRPGPRVITGDYRRSIESKMTWEEGNPVGIVGTNKPQGRRLEFGFVGTDSLGRYVQSPPFPHFRPALQTIGEPFQKALADAVVKL